MSSMTTTPPPPRRPKFWRRAVPLPVVVYAHPFELAFGLALIINGFRTILTGQTAPSIDDSLPELFILLYRLLSMGAGVCIVAGVFIAGHPTTRPQGRTIERVGLWLAAGSYGSYAFVLEIGRAHV